MEQRVRPLTKLVIPIATLDLFVAGSLAATFAETMPSADLRVFFGAYLAHSLISFTILLRRVEPVRRWQRGGPVDPLTVDRAMASAYVPFALVFTGTIVATQLLTVALAFVTTSAPLDPLVVVNFTAMALGVGLGVPALLSPMFEHVLLELRLVLANRSPSGKRRRSTRQKLLTLNLSLLAAVLVALLGRFEGERGLSARAATQSELRGRVALAAARAQLTLDSLEAADGVLILDQIPRELADISADSEGVRTLVELEHEEILAAAPLGADRWIVARASIELDPFELLTTLLIICVPVLIPGALGNLALTRGLGLSLTQLDDATRRIADEGVLHDLARPISLDDDELGALTGNFNRMIDVLEEVADAASAVAKGDLRADLDAQGDLQDAFRGMLARLNEVVVRIRDTSMELSSAAVELNVTAQAQGAAISQQSQRVSVVSDAISSLAQSADDISATATEVLDNAEQTRSMTDAMVERIRTLGVTTGRITELVEVIREIAGRSDLLALNGSLEATRAGEAGRGFAIVASEMRRLAERVADTVADVGDRVAEIESAREGTVAAADDSHRIADDTAAAARRIFVVTSRQSQDTEQVAREVAEVAEVTSRAVDASLQTSAAAEGLRLHATELERLIDQFQLRDSERLE